MNYEILILILITVLTTHKNLTHDKIIKSGIKSLKNCVKNARKFSCKCNYQLFKRIAGND